MGGGPWPLAPYSYVIWQDGNHYARSGATGLIDYEDADASSIITSALGTLPATGGTITLAPGTYNLRSTVTFGTKQGLRLLGPGVTLKWTGTTGGTMFKLGDGTTPPNRSFLDFGNCDIDCNSLADIVFDIHSAQKCWLGNANIINGRTSTIVLNNLADASSNGLTGNKNSTRSTFTDITSWGNIGTMVKLQGSGSATGIVTNNRFLNIYAAASNGSGGVNSKFADLVQWCDTNKWFGMYAILVANNAIGFDFGSTDGTGVYNEWVVFDCDTFATGPTGRVAVNFRANSKQNTIWLFNDPAAEGGTLKISNSTVGVVVDPATYSYDLRIMAASGSGLNNAIFGV